VYLITSNQAGIDNSVIHSIGQEHGYSFNQQESLDHSLWQSRAGLFIMPGRRRDMGIPHIPGHKKTLASFILQGFSEP
jgi:hypothetical protein